jgi:hypothetical protein
VRLPSTFSFRFVGIQAIKSSGPIRRLACQTRYDWNFTVHRHAAIGVGQVIALTGALVPALHGQRPPWDEYVTEKLMRRALMLREACEIRPSLISGALLGGLLVRDAIGIRRLVTRNPPGLKVLPPDE